MTRVTNKIVTHSKKINVFLHLGCLDGDLLGRDENRKTYMHTYLRTYVLNNGL